MYIYLCLVEGQGQHGYLTHTYMDTHTHTHIHSHIYTHTWCTQKWCTKEMLCSSITPIFFFNPNLERINITVYHSLTEINNCCNHYTIFW